jgi:hypothetical protein
VTRRRHSDAQLLRLASEGSAPAFASLLHRHRSALQRVVLDAADPRAAAEHTMRSAMRDLQQRRVTADTDVVAWITDLATSHAARDPSPQDVDQLLAADWFDRAWSRAERSWPSGSVRPRLPRWGALLLGGLALAGTSSLATYLYVTFEETTEIVGELVAEPIEPGQGLAPLDPTNEAPTEPDLLPAPELFGDIEIGELPTYDLTGRDDARPGPAEIGPRTPTDEDDPAASGTGGAFESDGDVP